jgi:hypothetical protein
MTSNQMTKEKPFDKLKYNRVGYWCSPNKSDCYYIWPEEIVSEKEIANEYKIAGYLSNASQAIAWRGDSCCEICGDQLGYC